EARMGTDEAEGALHVAHGNNPIEIVKLTNCIPIRPSVWLLPTPRREIVLAEDQAAIAPVDHRERLADQGSEDHLGGDPLQGVPAGEDTRADDAAGFGHDLLRGLRGGPLRR